MSKPIILLCFNARFKENNEGGGKTLLAVLAECSEWNSQSLLLLHAVGF